MMEERTLLPVSLCDVLYAQGTHDPVLLYFLWVLPGVSDAEAGLP